LPQLKYLIEVVEYLPFTSQGEVLYIIDKINKNVDLHADSIITDMKDMSTKKDFSGTLYHLYVVNKTQMKTKLKVCVHLLLL